MKYTIMKIFFPLVIIAFVIGCSELQNDLTQPEHVNIHKDGIGNTSSPNFHAIKLRENNWDIKSCQQCHASDYNGGTVGVSCNTCHSNPGGPEACNTCHGDFSDVTRIAPPTDLHNNISTDNKGVGAHTSHIYNIQIAAPLSCYDCHPNQTSPTEKYVFSHIDGLPAEISIEGYNSSAATCANTYCHGNFEFSKSSSANQFGYTSASITGNNFTPVWTTVNGTQAACGTCHGLPPTGHVYAELNTCVTCHPDVINASGEIIDPLKHADGEVQLISKSVLEDPNCNHCHSNRTEQPFRALAGKTNKSYHGVGLHNEHLFNTSTTSNVKCESCHIVPTAYNSEGHFDATPLAEVNFWKQPASTSNPTYNSSSNTCANTYCHGNFTFTKENSEYKWAYTGDVITGNSVSINWISGTAAQAECGTCHGLPPTGHIDADLTSCVNCHDSVVDATGKIINTQKHINGVVNLFGN